MIENQAIDILFVCVHNSGRSQMAEAFFNLLSHGKYLAVSAGTEPASQINPAVARVMAEASIDMQYRKPRLLTPELLQKARRIIIMGCGVSASCPASRKATEDWRLPDPEGMSIAEVKKLRDNIKARVMKLIKQLDQDLTHS